MAILQNLSTLSREQLEAMVTSMATANQRKLTMKVTAQKFNPKTGEMVGSNGAVSVYGLGRFPVTLYAGGWERLLDAADDIRAFIATNEAIITRK